MNNSVDYGNQRDAVTSIQTSIGPPVALKKENILYIPAVKPHYLVSHYCSVACDSGDNGTGDSMVMMGEIQVTVVMMGHVTVW